jgi:hypothetical protein
MKFTKEKYAPDIPIEILDAQENGTLVLFCGAGISYPAGLPLFSELVNQVYEELGDSPSELEKQAIKQWRYDTTLELLEKRYHSEKRFDNYLVRKAIASRLTFKSNAKFDTHKAILQLAKTDKQKYRLVTTNVDHGFKLADVESWKMSDFAPKLPVPKPHKWQSIVYLHGVIDENSDPNNEHLVFTSGDFGSAYLTERWASRFVSELFRHFTVLFVGYSIDDPVMRYMTDAIAADRRKGDKNFKSPYVLAGTKRKQFIKAKFDWEAKGVIPVIYEDRNRHTYLHKTLQAWAAYSQDDLNSVERIIRVNAIKSPVEPYEYDYSVKSVIDNLKKTDYAAKIFHESKAPISWLPILEKEGLLAGSEINENHLIKHSNYFDLYRPSKKTLYFWQWLVDYHLEEKKFVEWAITKQAKLHFQLIRLIESNLESNPTLQESYLVFWRIVVLQYDNVVFVDDFYFLKKLNSNKDALDLLFLTKQFEPEVIFSKSFSFDNVEHTKPYQAKVVIKNDFLARKIIQHINVNDMETLLLPITNCLKQTMEFWQLLGEADNKHDLSYWRLPSISPHPQNHRLDNWVILIELCRDFWVATEKTNKALALAILELWKTIPFPVFKRLIFHVYTISTTVSPSEQLNYLLSDNRYWLFSVNTQRETFRLLESFCSTLPVIDLIKLEQAILDGIPRDMCIDDLSDEKYQENNERRIWLFLAKLKSFNLDLSEATQIFYTKLSKKYPYWKLQDDERDEFNIWFSNSMEEDSCRLTVGDFINQPIENQIDFLSKKRLPHIELIDLINDHPERVLEILDFMCRDSNWNSVVWHDFLWASSEIKKPEWSVIAQLIVKFPKFLFEQEAWVISQWLNRTSELIAADSTDEEYFWKICELLIFNTKQTSIGEDVIHEAINHPIGILTEALLTRFSVRNITNANANDNLFSLLERLVCSNDEVFLLSKVVLMSRIHYFYYVYPEWTRANLMPLLNWESLDTSAILWKGFLWNPSISPDFAWELKEFLKTTLLYHSAKLGKFKKQLVQVFAVFCLESQEIYTNKEQKEILHSIDLDSLIDISEFIYRCMGDDGDNNDQYWKNRIKPFFQRAWAKDAESLHPDISKNFALMCISLSQEFEDAVNIMKKTILTPFKDIHFFLNQLKQSSHIKNHPLTTFELIAKIFNGNDVETWTIDDLKEILDALVIEEPSLKDNFKYKNIRRILLKQS